MLDAATYGNLTSASVEGSVDLPAWGKGSLALDMNLLNELMHDDIPMHHPTVGSWHEHYRCKISHPATQMTPSTLQTGNFIESEVDLRSCKPVLRLERTYNSVSCRPPEYPSRCFGKGWSSMLDSRLEQNPIASHGTLPTVVNSSLNVIRTRLAGMHELPTPLLAGEGIRVCSRRGTYV